MRLVNNLEGHGRAASRQTLELARVAALDEEAVGIVALGQ